MPDPEDDGSIIIRNVVNVSPHNITLYTSHFSFSNLKSRLKKLFLGSYIGLFEIGTNRQILVSVEIIVTWENSAYLKIRDSSSGNWL